MWSVFQIGAREHYGVARALQNKGELQSLVTDFWVPPDSMLGRLPLGRRLRDRYHHALQTTDIHAFDARMLMFEAQGRIRSKDAWSQIEERNVYFERLGIKVLREIDEKAESETDRTLFSYSYAARGLFLEAKRLGWKTVLGQIDPGPGEAKIVRELKELHPEWARTASEPEDSYWEQWREECELADRIVVNSDWSRQLIERDGGVDASKVEVIPLALETSPVVEEKHPGSKLRVLFLGQAIVRKGIHDLVEAARRVRGMAVVFDVVGPHGTLPGDLPSNVVFHGAVPRSEVGGWYARADVFVLPTHSDGFALTQLEAMANGLPVIATRSCGEVVEDGVNGWVFDAGDVDGLVDRICRAVDQPDQLVSMGEAAVRRSKEFGLDRVGKLLLAGQSE